MVNACANASRRAQCLHHQACCRDVYLCVIVCIAIENTGAGNQANEVAAGRNGFNCDGATGGF